MFFLPDIPPKQEGYSRNNNTFLKIEGFWRDKKSPKTLDAMRVFGHGASGDTAFFKKHSNINGFRTPEQRNYLYSALLKPSISAAIARFISR